MDALSRLISRLVTFAVVVGVGLYALSSLGGCSEASNDKPRFTESAWAIFSTADDKIDSGIVTAYNRFNRCLANVVKKSGRTISSATKPFQVVAFALGSYARLTRLCLVTL